MRMSERKYPPNDGTRKLECTVFPSVVSEVSLGKSIHQFISSSPLRMINSVEIITMNQNACLTKLNGSQFRQVYSSLSLQYIHSQIQHENNSRMQTHQTEVISNWASLFITSFFDNHSSIPMKHDRSCNYLIQFSHFNHFQRRHILNLTHGIVREGKTTIFNSLSLSQFFK